jgi:hypothetical protein
VDIAQNDCLVHYVDGFLGESRGFSLAVVAMKLAFENNSGIDIGT